MLVVEARARADVWLSRHVTLGVVAGVDVLGHGESVGVSLVVHVSPYDGG